MATDLDVVEMSSPTIPESAPPFTPPNVNNRGDDDDGNDDTDNVTIIVNDEMDMDGKLPQPQGMATLMKGDGSGLTTEATFATATTTTTDYDTFRFEQQPSADGTSVDLGQPKEWKKYSSYSVEVDPNQDDKATEINLLAWPWDGEEVHAPLRANSSCSLGRFFYIDVQRPHMRAFHCSWWCFFMAFFIWFSISPLLPEIKESLDLSKEQVWKSNIVGVSGTIAVRFVLGPFNDKYGARILFAIVLCAASIPTACTGLVQSPEGLYILRLFIGLAGGTFVMCQYWTSRMFAREVVGTANAICAGWGNLGGGVTQLVMGSVLFPLFKWIYDGDSEKAWRTICVIPAVVAFGSGVMVYYVSDDSPKGNYTELKRHGLMPPVSAASSFRSGAINFNSWLLFIQYACCFGVELTMNNAAASYFHDEFGQSTEKAAAIAFLFGWMNFFARGLGGYVSDVANTQFNGMQGRLLVQTLFLAAEGVLVLIFATCGTLGGAIVVMIAFSIFVQAAEGSTFGIVPYVDPCSTGSVSGIVGAGGNVGAVLFGLGFLKLNYRDAFFVMGFTILGSSVLGFLINIRGQSKLLGNMMGSITTFSSPENEAEQLEQATDGNYQDGDDANQTKDNIVENHAIDKEPTGTLVVPEKSDKLTHEVNS